jgi:flagellar basal-body rod protein FlgC
MDIATALTISARGMQAQTERLRVIAENLANQESTSSEPGGDPYRRRTTIFTNVIDRASGAHLVKVTQITEDPSEFPVKYDPSNPGANEAGYVKTPNVNGLVEMMDMREAERSYSANLNVMQTSRAMLTRVIELLK